jgi:hypothetical protein
MSLLKQRISDIDITEMDVPLVFLGKSHTIRIVQTCYGDYLVNTTHLAMISGIDDEKPASDHFYRISQRCAVLQHGNAKLKDHLKVCNKTKILPLSPKHYSM